MSEPNDTAQLFAALLHWIQGTTVRIAALESLLRQHLNLSKEDVEAALDKASVDFPLTIDDSQEAFEQTLDFLKRAANAKEPAGS